MAAILTPLKKESRSQNSFLRKLPLLEFTRTLHPATDLSSTYLICAQHLVSTTYSLFHALLSMGLKPNNLSAIGKCYSTDPTAFQEMKKLGIDVCPSSLSFSSHKPFDNQYRENIKKFVRERLKKLANQKFERIIILDDGGELISIINSLIEPNERMVGIEQTSSGFHKLNSQDLKLPIINMARSPAKLNYESPIIAQLVLDSFIECIRDLPIQPQKALIIGNGPIGSEIRTALENNYLLVSTFDKCNFKSSIASIDFEKRLKDFDLIIGCTGRPILGPKHYHLLKKNALLISASSSDREFSAVSLRQKLPIVTDCHKNLLINGIYLINCGFPINFSSRFRDIDSDKLQLTRSLLLTSILQANNHSDFLNKGFISLDIENQKDIIKKYLSIFPSKKISEREKLVI